MNAQGSSHINKFVRLRPTTGIQFLGLDIIDKPTKYVWAVIHEFLMAGTSHFYSTETIAMILPVHQN